MRASTTSTPNRRASVSACFLIAHQRGAFVAHDLLLIGLGQHAAHGGVQHRTELVVGAEHAVDRLIELQRIDNAVADEAVDLEALVVGGEHFEIRALDVEDAVVEGDDVLDQRELEVQARLGDEAAAGDRLAEAQHERLLGLVDGEQRAAGDARWRSAGG